MGRGSSSKVMASRSAAKRRRPGGAGVSTADARAFISGRAESATIHLDPTKVAKGPEHVLNRSGGGAHGKQGQSKHRADRKATKQSLRRGDDW